MLEFIIPKTGTPTSRMEEDYIPLIFLTEILHIIKQEKMH